MTDLLTIRKCEQPPLPCKPSEFGSYNSVIMVVANADFRITYITVKTLRYHYNKNLFCLKSEGLEGSNRVKSVNNHNYERTEQ